VNKHTPTSSNRKILYSAAAVTLLVPSLFGASVAIASAPSPEEPTPDPTATATPTPTATATPTASAPPAPETPAPETPAPEPDDTDGLEAETLVTGLQGASGGAVGPDGALYVAEGAAGTITRIDPATGETSTFASGLPLAVAEVGIGGAIDVAFVDDTAYVLVTLPGTEPSDETIHGIYRVDGPDDFTLIADLGAWSRENPPDYPVDLPSGVQFAFEPVAGGFLVTDGHHNRVLYAEDDGTVSALLTLDNVVPTGIDSAGDTIYLAEAGPVPHLPEDGRVSTFTVADPVLEEIASGYSLLVDVAVGGDDSVYALSQGDSPGDVPAGSPALPDSGELLVADDEGGFTALVEDLDLPVSLHLIDDAAYVVTLGGDVLRIADVIATDEDGDGHDHGDGDGDKDGDSGHHGNNRDDGHHHGGHGDKGDHKKDHDGRDRHGDGGHHHDHHGAGDHSWDEDD
jgi:hypothetical protein